MGPRSTPRCGRCPGGMFCGLHSVPSRRRAVCGFCLSLRPLAPLMGLSGLVLVGPQIVSPTGRRAEVETSPWVTWLGLQELLQDLGPPGGAHLTWLGLRARWRLVFPVSCFTPKNVALLNKILRNTFPRQRHCLSVRAGVRGLEPGCGEAPRAGTGPALCRLRAGLGLGSSCLRNKMGVDPCLASESGALNL